MRLGAGADPQGSEYFRKHLGFWAKPRYVEGTAFQVRNRSRGESWWHKTAPAKGTRRHISSSLTARVTTT